MTVNAVEAAEQEVEQIQAAAQPPVEQKPWGQYTTNALQASIASKREQSYYYAHAPRETFEPPAPLPVPVVLERSTAEAPPAIVTIFNYAWADEGELVKVYIPLEGVGAKCSDDDIKVAFEVRLFQVEVHGFKPRQIHRLLIQKLSGDIAPGDCQVKKLANKVVVILKKAGSHRKWYSLRHNV
ncbi:hypothetical protein Vretimale_16500 [Volvox reticuliferus]|uniref:CS domain-containing protein n=1 Tax=Volvox reticuliferus TaxID=1737510 RepID=A0A8J4FWQ6_9CHLO|nr:hypothetical protein Vretifemale_17573 [Volvox reticuliferus]GIM13447.1 hypothetical protein Vretimale_16500 [Volvox reticuliferus]